MNDIKTLTIQLEADDYEQLVAQAKHRKMSPGDIAEAYVRAGLTSDDELGAESRRKRGLEALQGLAALRQRLPDAGPVDAVELIYEGRADLDRRTPL